MLLTSPFSEFSEIKKFRVSKTLSYFGNSLVTISLKVEIYFFLKLATHNCSTFKHKCIPGIYIQPVLIVGNDLIIIKSDLKPHLINFFRSSEFFNFVLLQQHMKIISVADLFRQFFNRVFCMREAHQADNFLAKRAFYTQSLNIKILQPKSFNKILALSFFNIFCYHTVDIYCFMRLRTSHMRNYKQFEDDNNIFLYI